MARGKIVYVPADAHRLLRLLAARRERPMGEVVAALVEQEVADLSNPWTSPEGLLLQQETLGDVWNTPDLDVYDQS